jgi:hypothetical protein
MDFTSRLDVSKFTDLQKTMENNVILGTDSYPKTLNEPYTIAQYIKSGFTRKLKGCWDPSDSIRGYGFIVKAKAQTLLVESSQKMQTHPLTLVLITRPLPFIWWWESTCGPECKFKKTPQPKSNWSSGEGRSHKSEGLISFCMLRTIRCGVHHCW